MADITRGVRAFSIGTAISRVFGLVRESVFAYLFGAGMATDAYNAAFRLPNLLRDLFAETALSAAFVPVLTAEKQKGKNEQNLLASNTFNILLLVVGVVVILGILLSPYLTRIIAFGFGSVPNKLNLTTQLAAVMFPFLLFVVCAAWAMGYLNTEKEFFVPSLAPALFNVFSIAVPLLLYAYLTQRGIEPIFGMAIGVLCGGLMQFAIQIPMLTRKGFRYTPYLNFKDPNFKRIVILFIPVALGLTASRINVFVDTLLISFLEERSMTWLNYAFRIMHLPLGLFGIAVGTVALPTLSQFVVQKKFDEAKATLIDSLQLVFFLTLSTSIIMAFLSHPITRIIYEHGRFTSYDTSVTAQALILYSIGIPFIAAVRNIAAVFYAYQDSKTPMYASITSVGIKIVLNLILMRRLGFLAFPLTTTISSLINILILMHLVPRKIGAINYRPLLQYAFLVTVAALVGGILGLLLNRFLLQSLGSAFISQILALVASGALALALCYGVCLILGLRNVKIYLKELIRG